MQERDIAAEETARQRRIAKWRLAAIIVWTFVGIGVLVYFSGNALSALSVPVGIVAWCVIFVFGLRPSINWMNDKGMPRGLACTIAYVVMLVCVCAVFVLVTSPVFGIADQFDALVSNSDSITQGMSSFVDGLVERYPMLVQDPTVSEWVESTVDKMGAWTNTLMSNLAHSLVAVTAFTLNAIITVAFALVASFWILLETPNLRTELSRLFGERHIEDVDFLNHTFTRTLGGYLKGLVILCGVIGAGCSVGYTLVGMPNGVAMGIISGLCNVIPVLGQWVAAILVLVTALLMADLKTALLAALVAIAFQRVVYTVLYPKIMADSVDVHPVFVIIAMMVGYALGSTMSGVPGALVGMLISIPLAAVAKALFVYYFEKRTGRHLVAVDGVFFKGVPNSEEAPDPAHNASSPHPSAYAERLKADERRRVAHTVVAADAPHDADLRADAAGDGAAGAQPDAASAVQAVDAQGAENAEGAKGAEGAEAAPGQSGQTGA